MEAEIETQDILPVDDSPAAPPPEAPAVEAEPVERKVKSLDDAINQAMESRGYGEEGETFVDENGRTRRKDGKFAKSGEATDEVPADPATAAETVKAETAQQPLQAPLSMSDADKAIFAKLPLETQKFVTERYKQMEADYTRKTQEVAEQRKQHEPVLNTINHWSPYLQKIGLTPDKAFDQFMNVEHALRMGSPEQRQAAYKYLGDLYGISSVTGQQPATQVPGTPAEAAAECEWVDPEVLKLREEITGLKSQLSQVGQTVQQRELQVAQAEFASLGATKDESGQPKYPHFDAVGKDMIRYVAEGQAQTWDEAYEMATWSRKDLREALLQEHRAKLVREEEARRQAAVAKAKGAAPVKVSHGVGESKSGPKGLSAHLDAAISKL